MAECLEELGPATLGTVAFQQVCGLRTYQAHAVTSAPYLDPLPRPERPHSTLVVSVPKLRSPVLDDVDRRGCRVERHVHEEALAIRAGDVAVSHVGNICR